jgi:hypothetical protein
MASLFEDFEVNHTPFWPRIGGLLGGSLGVHMVAMAAILYVPAFRDALNIAFLFSGAEFVSRDYTRTTIGDDVQIVDLAGGKFRYPDGYFAPEGAQPAAEQRDPFAAQIISRAGSGLRIKPASTPTPTPEPTPTPTPSQSPTPAVAGSTSTGGAGTPGNDKKSEVAKEEKELTPEEAQKQLEKIAAENNIELPKEGEINKKALKDFGIYANEMKNNGKLDLDQPFEVVIESELDEHGKLKNPEFTKKAGDPNLTEISGRMIAALNDSGFLIYLKRINLDNPGTKIIFTVKMDKAEVVATVESEASSADSARILAAGFKAALGYGMLARKGKDEEVLLKNTTVEPDGKRIKFNLTMPRQPVVDLIKKQLAAS